MLLYFKDAIANFQEENYWARYLQQLNVYKEKISQEHSLLSEYAFLQVPYLDDYIENIYNLYKKKKLVKPKLFVVIGIGGSNLGAEAVQEAILGNFFNEISDFKIYYADTVDVDSISDILKIVEAHLILGSEIILNVISKSGKTTETIANFQIFLALLQKYKKNYKDFVVVTTDKGSGLYNYAMDNQFDILEIPKLVGGRYSVFTAVGIFPLMFLSIDIKQLLGGAKKATEDFFESESDKNTPILRAALLALIYNKNIIIHDLFVFSKNLQMYSYWYRQLMAESIGKEFDKYGNKVEISFTPTVSVGSADLHSVAQLYLADKIERFTTFITVKNSDKNIIIPENSELDKIVSDISGIKIDELMHIICQGVQRAYKKKGRPFCTLELERLNEFDLGYLMQSNMIEIVLLAHLLNIDPFNQPNVELYKSEVRDMLRLRNG